MALRPMDTDPSQVPGGDRRTLSFRNYISDRLLHSRAYDVSISLIQIAGRHHMTLVELLMLLLIAAIAGSRGKPSPGIPLVAA